MNSFIDNTLDYERKKSNYFSKRTSKLNVDIFNKQVLLVIRGQHYIDDLVKLRSFIYKNNPVLIGVDGGADVLVR